MRFSDIDLNPALQRGVTAMGYCEPTAIQSAALPPALNGKDILASAMTGSGKTAAFVLPILQRLVDKPGRSTRALIVTPTRELASQILEHIRELGRFTGIRSVAVFGGVKPGPQEKALRAGVDVVVACPGRLLDHMRQSWLRLDKLEILVLDEADRMLDMGFLPDIRRILAQLPKRRQTMLFSATLPQPIVTLSRNLLADPVRLGIEESPRPATGVRQAAITVHEPDKKELLLSVLGSEVRNALVFTRTKHRANRLAMFLDKSGVACDRIHGNRSQKQREKALSAFKSGRIRVLVATDVVSRGIDVEALSHVINFDVPNQPEDYVHRVGRTARAGATGDALTFVSPSEEGGMRAIERRVGRRINRRRAGDLQTSVGSVDRDTPVHRSTGRRGPREDRKGAPAGPVSRPQNSRRNGNSKARKAGPAPRSSKARHVA